MRRRRTDRHETFAPLADKSLSSVLRHLFVTEFGYENMVLFADAMIERILETIDIFLKPANMLQPGQMLWMAVANDGRRHAYQAMKDTPQVPVILDVVTDEDLRRLANGEEYVSVRRCRHARLLQQAFAAGGVLAQGDLAAITLTARTQVGVDIARFQEKPDQRLPYRGSVQDIGATISHRVDVVRMLEAGYLEPEICRRLSPVHDLRSVENYAQAYKNVLKLLDRGFAPEEVAGILRMGKKRVDAYVDLVCEHHPDIKERNHHLPKQGGAKPKTQPRGHVT